MAYPGYDVDFQYLDFRSDRYPNVSEITDFIKGTLLCSLFEHRLQKMEPDTTRFNYGQTRFLRMNTYSAYCNEPTFTGNLMSIQYTIDYYAAGAAHPNCHFKTFNFLLEPLILVNSLRQMFKDEAAAFSLLQSEIRLQLRVHKSESEGEERSLDTEWIDGGTKAWDDFAAFHFTKESLVVLFAPYRVGSYAEGAHFAELPCAKFAPLMRPEYISGMHLERFIR